MNTDELISSLSEGLTPAPRRRVVASLLLSALFGLAVALVMSGMVLGLRPDLPAALDSSMFWIKAAYMGALGLAGLLAAERLTRPAGDGRPGLVLAGLAAAIIAAAAVYELATAPEHQRLQIWLGGSWSHCPANIVFLALPMMGVCFFFARRLAPVRLALTGASLGLFSGGVAGLAYCLHCDENGMSFLASWYSLGVALCALIGAALGPRLLRW